MPYSIDSMVNLCSNISGKYKVPLLVENRRTTVFVEVLVEVQSHTVVAGFWTAQGVPPLPNKGLSEVTGIVSTTMLRNTVSERRIVTPETI